MLPTGAGSGANGSASASASPFVPNAFQQAILEALEGRALRTRALGDAVGDCSRLYKPGGLAELRAQKLVAHHERLGFYSTLAPPPQLPDAGGSAGRSN